MFILPEIGRPKQLFDFIGTSFKNESKTPPGIFVVRAVFILLPNRETGRVLDFRVEMALGPLETLSSASSSWRSSD